MKIFRKVKTNGRRDFYLFGKKIFSYKRPTLEDRYRAMGIKVGKNFQPIVHPHPWSVPDFGSEPCLIEIGDDVCISFGCTFVTHDGSIDTIRRLHPDKRSDLVSKYGRIKIGNNVFIGCKSTVLPNVTIGNNCIVGACSVVTKDIPDGEIWAGNPAKFVTTVDKYSKKLFQICSSEEQKALNDLVHDFLIKNGTIKE